MYSNSPKLTSNGTYGRLPSRSHIKLSKIRNLNNSDSELRIQVFAIRAQLEADSRCIFGISLLRPPFRRSTGSRLLGDFSQPLACRTYHASTIGYGKVDVQCYRVTILHRDLTCQCHDRCRIFSRPIQPWQGDGDIKLECRMSCRIEVPCGWVTFRECRRRR